MSDFESVYLDKPAHNSNNRDNRDTSPSPHYSEVEHEEDVLNPFAPTPTSPIPYQGGGGGHLSSSPPSYDGGIEANPFAASTESQIEESHFVVKIPEHTKLQSGRNAYISYKIVTETNLAVMKAAHTEIYRRYNDFLWFYGQLRANNKGVLIPPLPEKHDASSAVMNRISGDFDAEFIETRRRGLEKFLNRVAHHRILHRRQEFINFLEMSEQELTKAQRDSPSRLPSEVQQEKKENSIGSKLTSFVYNTVSNITSAASSGPKEIAPWFDTKKKEITAQQTQINTLLRACSSQIRSRQDMAFSYQQFANAMEACCKDTSTSNNSNNSNISGGNSGFHSHHGANYSTSENSFVDLAFQRVSGITKSVKDLTEMLILKEMKYFEDSLKDYVRLLSAVEDMFADRDKVLQEYQEVTSKALQNKAKSGTITDNDVYDEETKRQAELKKEYDTISELCKEEYEIFCSTREKEMRRIMIQYAQANMDYSVQVVDQWKGFMSDAHSGNYLQGTTINRAICWGGSPPSVQ
eukprot:TRINITY_DN5451_c0_g1_i1.p1 TRINITY_DN5451_c0_g1~~TRINITY_DN5451_c0_g1_i1.p1  ORF type:complete len:522 (+),score=179.01 TRINITY_DN5451_c0_g1_i1:141-1706(+)